jgi:hypothetical protein
MINYIILILIDLCFVIGIIYFLLEYKKINDACNSMPIPKAIFGLDEEDLKQIKPMQCWL